jgi:predicted CoA-binding protein
VRAQSKAKPVHLAKLAKPAKPVPKPTSVDQTRKILSELSVVAVVGMSRDPAKAAHSVPADLQAAGFRIVPVNPEATELLGEKAFATLADIPFPIELVLVFRPARFTPDIARQAVAIGAKALWLQQGIYSSEARSIATAAGLAYVEDRCAGVERALYRVSH